MNVQKTKELYRQSHSFPLDSRIESLINQSTLSAETLRFLGTLVQFHKPTYLLEFGSGLSTLHLMNASEKNPSAHIFTVDHSSHYLQKTKEILGGTKNITCILSPIKLYQFRLKGFTTYDNIFVRQIPRGLTFDMVLIDGPPGYRFGREAPLYQIAPFLTSKTLILLDDANRGPEQNAISNWRRVWTDGIDVLHFPEVKKGFAIIQLKNPTKMARFPFGIREIRESWLKARKVMHIDEEKKIGKKNEN